jgi:hypothetical protein
MPLRARSVLNDCRVAHGLLESETDDHRWRVYWVAAVALVRAVGHVLKKVDGRQSPRLGKILETLFREWNSGNPAHEIFSAFIEDERNSILKQYQFRVSQGPVEVALLAGDVNDLKEITAAVLDENIYRPMTSGAFEGWDARDVLESAIDWWQSQLDEIERRLAEV